MNKLISVLLTLCLLAGLACGAASAEAPADAAHHLTILATSDLHANIIGYSYEDDKPTTNNGMARLYTYIQQVRAENPNTLLIEGGDDIQGTIMTDDLYNKNPEAEHPVIAAMNYMGYDVMTLGNHEFNWGVTTMNTILGQAQFPVLAANAHLADGSLLTGQGWIIKEVDGVKVAVIGVVSPNIQRWDGGKEGIDDLKFDAVADAVEAALNEIGDQADLIVVSAHTGMFAEYDEENGSDACNTIIERCGDKIDVLQSAHAHVSVSEDNDVTVVGAARNGGRELVRFDLYLDADNNVIYNTVELIDMDGVTPSEEITSLPVVAKAHEETRAFVTGGTGENGEEGGTPLGTTTARFQPDNEIAGLPAGKLMDTAVIDFINKVQMEAAGADVAACALFKDTSDLPEGNINYGNIFDIYKFDNTLYRVTVTGAELKAYMEWSAECYNQWVPGDINISFNPDKPGYLYDMFSGVDYEIDLSQPAGSRIVNVMFKGEPLADDQILTLAVNNYRYSSGLKTFGLVAGTREWESPCSIRDLLVAYFAEHSPVAPEVDNNWRIVGCDLSEEDPRRAEIIELVNQGLLDAPYSASYNLNNYDEIMASVKAEAEAQEDQSH